MSENISAIVSRNNDAHLSTQLYDCIVNYIHTVNSSAALPEFVLGINTYSGRSWLSYKLEMLTRTIRYSHYFRILEKEKKITEFTAIRNAQGTLDYQLRRHAETSNPDAIRNTG